MYRPRLIPVLLLKGRALVKTLKFKSPIYLGDPINAVRLFNDMNADELIFLDINASKESRCVDVTYVREIAEEARMPFSVGGGINSLEDMEALLKNGSEKVIINTAAFKNPDLITQAANQFGSQSVVVCIDVRQCFGRKYIAYITNGNSRIKYDVMDYCRRVVDYGAGELMIQSIDRDGTYRGYDVELASRIANSVSVPITICGGASSLDNMVDLYRNTHVQGLAAGSLFVFHSGRDSFLINYPNDQDKDKLRSVNGI